YSQKVLNECSEPIARIEALYQIGVSYSLKGEIADAAQFLSQALELAKQGEQAAYIEWQSMIMAYQGWMEAATYLKFSKKSICKIDDAIEIVQKHYHDILSPKIATRLKAYHYTTKGDALCKMGLYQQALDDGFQQAQRLLDLKVTESPHFILNLYIQIGMGECYLRLNQLDKAQAALENVIHNGSLLVGEWCALLFAPRVLLLEIYLKLKNYPMAKKLIHHIYQTKRDKLNYTKLIDCLFSHLMIVCLQKENTILQQDDEYIHQAAVAFLNTSELGIHFKKQKDRLSCVHKNQEDLSKDEVYQIIKTIILNFIKKGIDYD
ncbi:MAG: tetratricopeptide repeat protein, partial [Alphaproteobacteria bacterium]|nr:tetratricopeptide repeat protein [Alphaproteobacteria bacterium]